MKRFALALAIACAPALAEPLFQSGELTVTFHKERCELEHLRVYLKQYAPNPKRAAILFQGKQIKGCYVVDAEGDYIVADEFGNGGAIPSKAVNPGV